MKNFNLNIFNKVVLLLIFTTLTITGIVFQFISFYPLLKSQFNMDNKKHDYSLLLLQNKSLIVEKQAYIKFLNNLKQEKTSVSGDEIRKLTIEANKNINIKQFVLQTDYTDSKKKTIIKTITISTKGKYKTLIEFINSLEKKFRNINVTKVSFKKGIESEVTGIIALEVFTDYEK